MQKSRGKRSKLCRLIGVTQQVFSTFSIFQQHACVQRADPILGLVNTLTGLKINRTRTDNSGRPGSARSTAAMLNQCAGHWGHRPMNQQKAKSHVFWPMLEAYPATLIGDLRVCGCGLLKNWTRDHVHIRREKFTSLLFISSRHCL